MKFIFLARIMTGAMLFVMGVSAYSSPPNKASPGVHERHDLTSSKTQSMNTNTMDRYCIRGHDCQSMERLQYKSNIYSHGYMNMVIHSGAVTSNDVIVGGSKANKETLQPSGTEYISSGTREVAAATEIVYVLHNTRSIQQRDYTVVLVHYTDYSGRRSVFSSCLSA